MKSVYESDIEPRNKVTNLLIRHYVKLCLYSFGLVWSMYQQLIVEDVYELM